MGKGKRFFRNVWRDVMDPGRRDRRQAEEHYQDAQTTWDQVAHNAPSIDELTPEYTLEGFGYLLPESEMAGAGADEMSIAAQRQALQGLQDVHRQGGWTDAERAQAGMAARQFGNMAAGREGALTQQAYARGLGGGGAEMMGRLQASQSGANRAADYNAQLLAEGQRRALQALQASGQLGGQIRDQSFYEDTTRRGAVDDWNRNNTEYRRGVQGRNVDRLNERGRLRSAAHQQGFDNQSTVAAGKTNQYSQQAGASLAREQSAIQSRNNAVRGAIDFFRGDDDD